MLFWEDMIAWLICLKYYYFLCQYTFILNHLDLNIHATIKEITLRIMLGSIPHQKFCFYHLPTRGRARIKPGDAWYVSNISIIFDCSMLLYYLFWLFMGFTIHFYIMFGTNLLTQSPVLVPVFSLVSVFRRKGISNGVETEWNLLEKLFLEGKQPGGLGVHVKKAMRKAQGRGARPPPWARPPLSWAPRGSPDRFLSPI